MFHSLKNNEQESRGSSLQGREGIGNAKMNGVWTLGPQSLAGGGHS